MDKILSSISKQAEHCNCGQKHYELNIEKIVVKRNALKETVSFLEEKDLINVVIIVDKNTYEVAGKALSGMLNKAPLKVNLCFIEPDENGDVVANEESIVQVLLEVPNNSDVLLAVGSGTIHDIGRIVSYKMGLPFVSIPTAPSVDGFNSMGAPLVIKGVKTTYQTQAPIAVFADLNILMNSPKKMVAAGFGDMLGKSTSLADWRFSHLVGGEPFCPLVYKITKEALDSCVTNLDQITTGSEEGIRVLIEALINSGLAMLLMGQSHPASGAEHHLSHYWEMDFIKNGRPQVLHGAKVSVACYLIAHLYKTDIKNTINSVLELGVNVDGKFKKVMDHKEEIIEILNSIPESSKIKGMVKALDGETEPIVLGISEDLLLHSFREAHLIRDRYTFLRFYNENCLANIK